MGANLRARRQFLDPLLLISEVRREAGRRISFLVAEASMNRRFIGQAAKLMQSSESRLPVSSCAC